MASNKIPELKLFLGPQFTTLASVFDYMMENNNIGKKEIDECLVEYQGFKWKISKLPSTKK